MYLSLSLLKTSPFVADHSKTVLMSFSNMRIFCKIPLGRHVLQIIVSSADLIESESIEDGSFATYVLKRIGPRIRPWGTPKWTEDLGKSDHQFVRTAVDW